MGPFGLHYMHFSSYISFSQWNPPGFFWDPRGRVINQSFYCWPSRSSQDWTINFWRVFFLSLGSLLCSLLHALMRFHSPLASFRDHFPTPFPWTPIRTSTTGRFRPGRNRIHPTKGFPPPLLMGSTTRRRESLQLCFCLFSVALEKRTCESEGDT